MVSSTLQKIEPEVQNRRQSRCPLANPPDVLATPARARPVAADTSPRASFRLEVGAGGYPQTHERSPATASQVARRWLSPYLD